MRPFHVFCRNLLSVGLLALFLGCAVPDPIQSPGGSTEMAPDAAPAAAAPAPAAGDIANPFEKFALIIDDSRFDVLPPNDAEHDQFIRDNVAARLFELGDVDEVAVYRPTGVVDEGGDARVFELEFLMQYQYVLWHVNYKFTHATGLYINETQLGSLTTYLNAGGRLFLIGDRLSSNLVSLSGNFIYPKAHPSDPNGPGFAMNSFIWQKMFMRNEIVSVPTSASQYVQEASCLVGATSRHRAYPDLLLDTNKVDPFEVINDGARYRAGIHNWEGVLNSFEPQFYPGLVPLYNADVFDNTLNVGPLETGYDEAVLAHRYAWRALGRQARIVVFGFQPWWFEAGGLRQATDRAIDWLVTGNDGL